MKQVHAGLREENFFPTETNGPSCKEEYYMCKLCKLRKLDCTHNIR